MNKIAMTTIIALATATLLTGCSQSARTDHQSTDAATSATNKTERNVLYWYDPMNPTVHFQRPGKSPFMDMDLQPMYADEGNNDPNVISVDPAMVQNIGVITAPVEKRKLTRTINTYGVVMPDEKSISDINARASGWIEHLFFDYTGMEVRKGQPVAVIYSPELIASEQEFLQAINFASAGGSGATQSNALINSARERLAFFGMSNGQVNQLQKTGLIIDRVVIHSLQDGVILEKDAYEGQKIAGGQTLFRVADLRRVWILADVFKIDMPFLRSGSPATVTYDNAASDNGAVDFIYPEVDPTARSVKARIPLANVNMAMKVGQYVNVAIHSPVSYDAVAVPSEAVINTGLRKVVAVALGEGKFEMRDVDLGAYADGYYAVRNGLSEGETIVISGQFLIDSDANLKSAGSSLGSGSPKMDAPVNKAEAHHAMEKMNNDRASVKKNSTEN